MYKYKKLGAALLLSGILAANTVTAAWAESGGPGAVGTAESSPTITLEGPSASAGPGAAAGTEAAQEPSGSPVIDATGGKGSQDGSQSGTVQSGTVQSGTVQSGTVQGNAPQGGAAEGGSQQPAAQPGAPGTDTAGQPQDSQGQAGQAPVEGQAPAGDGSATTGQDNALSDAQGAELEAEKAAAEAEAQEDPNNPLRVPSREPHLQTTVLLNDAKTWSQAYVNDQQISTEGQSFSSISTFLENIHGNLLYRTYNSTTGWTGWSMNGQQTTHQSQWLPVEAIQYRFAGPVADKYDIYYRATLSDGTETDWAMNGASAGTMNKGLFMTGYRLAFFVHGTATELKTENPLVSDHADGIQIVDGAMKYIHGNGDGYTGWGWQGNDRYYFVDSNPVTGWQYIDGFKYYFGEDGKMWSDVESLVGGGPYMLKINKEMNCLTVYAKDGENGFIIPVKSFLTSVGDDTPIGTFRTPEKYRWRLMIHDVYTQYATRLGAGLPILIHSIIYDAPNPYTVWASTYNNLGIARSAGCIRLASGDAKWVYDNCPIGTTVVVYNSSVAGPFERPTIKAEIPFEQTWDPTDPNVTEEGIAAESARILAKFQS